MHRTWIVTASYLAVALVTLACTGGGQASDEDAQVGRKAPKFSLMSASGEEVSLEDYLGQRPVLLYFSMGPG